MTASILVTGAPGNVGTPLVAELLRLGAPVRVAAWDVATAQAGFADEVIAEIWVLGDLAGLDTLLAEEAELRPDTSTRPRR